MQVSGGLKVPAARRLSEHRDVAHMHVGCGTSRVETLDNTDSVEGAEHCTTPTMLMNTVIITAMGSTQKTDLRAFGRLMTKVRTMKKMKAAAAPVRIGLKN